MKIIGSPPKDALKEVHLWADYVELRCLVSPDLELTTEDLVAALRLDPEDSPDADDSEEDVSQDADGDPESGEEGSNATKVDNRFRLAFEVFELLETRFLMYDEAYPFAVDDGRIERCETLSPLQQTYTFLLLCSSGRYVVQHGQLTKSFERLCASILAAAIPGADVHIFGTAQDGGSKFSGNFVTRAEELAGYLGEELTTSARAISPTENGDRGLDIVATIELGDKLPSRLVIFGQAATGRDWHTKQHSVTNFAWDAIVQVTAPAVATCLIPLCFRDVAGNWHDSTLIHRSWVIDRLRILHQARKKCGNGELVGWEDPSATDVLQKVLDYRFMD